MNRHVISYFSFFFFFLIQEGKIGKEKKPQKLIPGKPKCDSINFYRPKQQVFFCFSNGVGDFLKIKDKFLYNDK